MQDYKYYYRLRNIARQFERGNPSPKLYFGKKQFIGVISGFRRDVDGNCILWVVTQRVVAIL